MAFKLSGFPTQQTKATVGGVTPFKHTGTHDNPGYYGGQIEVNSMDANHYDYYHGGNNDYDPDTDPVYDDMYDPTNPTGGMDFGLTFGNSGRFPLMPVISGDGAKMIADWGTCETGVKLV